MAIARIESRFADARIHSHDLTAIAPRMPMTMAQIIDGAIRRAQALLSVPRVVPDHPVFAMGLEGGVDRLPIDEERWTLQTWAAVTDGETWGYGAGPSLALPRAVSARVAAGEELGDVVDQLASEAVRGTRGAWGVLTQDLIGRRDAFRQAVIAAFAPFYNASMWRS